MVIKVVHIYDRHIKQHIYIYIILCIHYTILSFKILVQFH